MNSGLSFPESLKRIPREIVDRLRMTNVIQAMTRVATPSFQASGGISKKDPSTSLRGVYPREAGTQDDGAGGCGMHPFRLIDKNKLKKFISKKLLIRKTETGFHVRFC